MELGSMNITSQGNDTVQAENSTDRLSVYPIWYWSARGIISFVTIMGNGLVIYLVATRRHLRKQASPTWFILSLAVADLCVGLFNVPSSVVCRYWAKCSYVTYLIINNVMDVFMIASVVNLCLLTMDRYLAVIHPFTYINFVHFKSRIWLLILAGWIISILKGLPYFTFKLLRYKQALFYDSIAYMLLFTVVPNVVTLVAYVKIIVVIKRHRLKIDEQEMQVASNMKTNNNKSNANRNAQLKVAVVAVGILNVIFLFCNGFFQYYLTCNLLESCVISRELRYATFLLRYFNSAPNVFVYALAKRTFRQEIRTMFSTGQSDSHQFVSKTGGV